MSSGESLPVLVATVLLATGTFAFRVAGPLLRSRITFSPRATELMETAAVALLTALVATTALTEGGQPAGVARPLGAWRRVPFLVVVLAAASVTAGLRQLGVE